MNTTRKLSVSLPSELVDDLDYLSARLGVSRSAIIGGMLHESIRSSRRLLEMVQVDPDQEDSSLRMRGDSIEIVHSRLASLQGMANDLFRK